MTDSQISGLVDECLEGTKLGFSRFVSLHTQTLETQNIQYDLDCQIPVLDFSDVEDPAETLRLQIEADPMLIQKPLHGFMLKFVEALYKSKQFNPKVFDHLIIHDYNKVVFRARLKASTVDTSGGSLFFEVNIFRRYIEDGIRKRINVLRTEKKTTINPLYFAIGIILIVAGLPPIIRAWKNK